MVNNPSEFSLLVMAWLSSLLYADYVNLSALPAIHVLSIGKKDVDARDKPGHDETKDMRPAEDLLRRAFGGFGKLLQHPVALQF
jgi:hypothetical protein